MKVSKKATIHLTWVKLNSNLKDGQEAFSKKGTKAVIDAYTQVLADVLERGNDIALGEELGALKLKPYVVRPGKIGESTYEGSSGRRVQFSLSNKLRAILKD